MELNHLGKELSLELPYPKYQELQKTYVHLKDLQINDYHHKRKLPVHVILGISEYTKTKIQDGSRVGLSGEPITKLNKFG